MIPPHIHHVSLYSWAAKASHTQLSLRACLCPCCTWTHSPLHNKLLMPLLLRTRPFKSKTTAVPTYFYRCIVCSTAVSGLCVSFEFVTTMWSWSDQNRVKWTHAAATHPLRSGTSSYLENKRMYSWENLHIMCQSGACMAMIIMVPLRIFFLDNENAECKKKNKKPVPLLQKLNTMTFQVKMARQKSSTFSSRLESKTVKTQTYRRYYLVLLYSTKCFYHRAVKMTCLQ